MLTSILTSMCKELAGAGIKRMFRSAYFALLIRGAFNEKPSSEVIGRLTKELERAIGNSGELTEPVGNFLNALSHTGLIASLCETAALYSLDQEGKVQIQKGHLAAFTTLYGQYVDVNPETARKWYERIVRALTVAFHNSGDVKLEAAMRDITQREILQRLRALDRRIETIFLEGSGRLRILDDNALISVGAVEDEVSEIAHRLLDRYSTITLYGPDMRRRSAKIDEIFVPCNLQPSRRKSRTHSASRKSSDFYTSYLAGSAAKLPGLKVPKSENLNYLSAEDFFQPLDDEPISPSEFTSNIHRSVVLGNPGGGKTTLVHFIASKLCELAIEGKGPLPIVVVVRDFEKALLSRPHLTLEDFITENLGIAITRKVSPDLVRNLLAFGRTVLIFDGLDEIMNLDKRGRFVDDVRVFSSAHPLCSTLITSRIIGYDKAPLPEDFTLYILQELTSEQSKGYFKSLSSALTGMSENELDKCSDDFISKTSHATDLVSNPLMISLMTWLYHERRGEMPATKARLYRACAELLFEQWDKVRDIEFPGLPESFQVSRLLPELAWDIYQSESLSASVDREWLKKKIESYLLDDYDRDREARAKKDSTNIVDFITGRAWVLTDSGPNLYRFTHRTFLEYFFSRSLNDRSEAIDDLFQLIGPKIKDGTWAVPAALALDDRIFNRAPSALQIADTLSKIVSKVEPGSDSSIVAFCLDALDYLSGAPEAQLRELLASILDASPYVDTAANILKSSNRRRSVLLDCAAAFVVERLSNRSSETGIFADWLCYSDGQSLEDFLVVVREKLSASSTRYADEDISLAKIRLDLLGTHAEIAARNGAGVWESAVTIYNRINSIVFDICRCLRALEQMFSNLAVGNKSSYGKFAISLANAVASHGETVSFPSAPILGGELPSDFPFLKLLNEANDEISKATAICIMILRDCKDVFGGRTPFGFDFSTILPELCSNRIVGLVGSCDRRLVRIRPAQGNAITNS